MFAGFTGYAHEQALRRARTTEQGMGPVCAPPIDLALQPRTRMRRVSMRVRHMQLPRFNPQLLAPLAPLAPLGRATNRVGSGLKVGVKKLAAGLKSSADQHGEVWAAATYASRGPSLVKSAVEMASKLQSGEAWSADPALGEVSGITSVSVVGNGVETLLAVRRCLVGERTIGQTRSAKTDLAQQTQLLQGVLDDAEVAQTMEKIHEARRAVKVRKKATLERPEKAVDVLRYTAVSWGSRAAAIAQVAISHGATVATVAVHALHIASGVLGIVSGAAQMVSGLVKWRAARKAIALGRLNLSALPSTVAGESHLLAALRQRVLAQRKGSLARAQIKQRNAIIETCAGALVIGFTAGALAFPPLIFGSIAVGLLYASYRVGLGGQALWAWHQSRQDQKTTQAFNQQMGHKSELEKSQRQASDPRYALHCAFQDVQCAQDPSQAEQWSRFLDDCGVPAVEVHALRAMIRAAQSNQDAQSGEAQLRTANAIFDAMVLGEIYQVHSSKTGTFPTASPSPRSAR
jgi:hypothetical protein